MGSTSKTFELILNARDGASKVLSNFAKEMDKTKDKVKKTKEEVEKFNSKFGILAMAAGVAATGVAVGAFVKNVADANDALNDMSDRTGVAVEVLAGLYEIAQAGDVSIETLVKSLYKLGVAALNTPEQFEALGLGVNDASGKIKSSEVLFEEAADLISGISDPARQAAAATALFGKAGLELLPTLKMGSAGMKAWREDTKRLGGETSVALAKLSGEFNDNLQRVGIAFKGIANDILGGLLPAFNLLLGTFIEFASILRESATVNDEATESVSRMSFAFNTLVNVVGAVGNVVEVVYDTVMTVFKTMTNFIAGFISDLVTVQQALGSLISGDVSGVMAAVKEGERRALQLANELDKDFQNRFGSERFWSKLERAGAAAMKKIEDAASEAGKAGDGAVKLLASVGTAQIKTTTAQLDQLGLISEKSSAKAKKAYDDQKKVADDFEALVKSLNKSAPKDGNLAQKFDKAFKADELRLKKTSLMEKFAAEDAKEADAKRITALQEVIAEKQKAADKDEGFYAQQALRDAKQNLMAEESWQKLRERQAELQQAEKDAADKAISEQTRLELRAATASDLADIYAQLEKNAKAKTSNEGEIDRLREVGKMLQDNKDKATGLFSADEIKKYASEIEKVANAAAKSDADAARAENEAQLEKTKAKLEELRSMLLNVKLGVDDESIKKEAERIVEIINGKLKGIVLPEKLTQNYDDKGMQSEEYFRPHGFADGGMIHGPGTSRQDNIPIMVSAGEYIMPAHRMRESGMYQLMESLRGGVNMNGLLPRNKFADGGSVMPRMDSGGGNSWTLDIRTNSGTIKVTPQTTQDQLDRDLRKQNLRKS